MITPGRIVQYRLTKHDAVRTNARRADAVGEAGVARGRTGAIAHFGNHVSESDAHPAMVVAAHEDGRVNLQVFLDGNDTLWVTSVSEGHENGQWFWPERVAS